ncbi:hypothetical protein MPSEU_000917300 [Mayamaea pseudoterrestris]|nr:hypothetical protein MPSEU_000917300 [Mayamaea pseudoterrestris]
MMSASLIRQGLYHRACTSINHDISLVSRRFLATGNGDKSAKSKGSTSSASDGSSNSFRPRRRPSQSYRPIQPKKNKKVTDWSPGNPQKFITLQDGNNKERNIDVFGPLASDVIREFQEQLQQVTPLSTGQLMDEQLRMADYILAEQGSTEDLVGERRALAGIDEEDDLVGILEENIARESIKNLDLDDTEFASKPTRPSFMSQLEDDQDDHDDDPETILHRNQLAHGEWSEMLVKVDRNIKLWRGGRLESYRALVVGGNMNGCGGFGFGKSKDPLRAVDLAARHCKRNIFFVDRYQNNGITRDLAGKHNSCIVKIRATDNGLRGNPLVAEILKRFGIVNAVSKAHGNRNPYNVVRATYKALMTHESLEEIALKRGKRLVSIDRAMRMQV